MTDPRLTELQQIGLAPHWLDVAAEIGVDAFLSMWRILDRDAIDGHGGELVRVRVPRYRSYLRFQRNRYVQALHREGLPPREIREKVVQELGEKLTVRHILRIIAR